jgi:hypothetical protein
MNAAGRDEALESIDADMLSIIVRKAFLVQISFLRGPIGMLRCPCTYAPPSLPITLDETLGICSPDFVTDSRDYRGIMSA